VRKRAQVVTAARAAFGRDGYTRVSIDRIALDAAVSTRTIYNHFASKETLFTAAIEESATLVAEQLATAAERQLALTEDLQEALTGLAKSWFRFRQENAAHFAMVRQAMADAPHLPRELVARWIAVGPAKSTRVLADLLRPLMDQGCLRASNPERAANHFIMLTIGELSRESFGETLTLSEAQIDLTVREGVEAFLKGYAGRRE
jgi:AcrR family transcriptional regulator